MTNKVLDTILENTYSLTDLHRRFRLLKEYLIEQIFGTKADISYASQVDLQWLDSLGKVFARQFNKDNIYQQFQELENQIKKITPLTIYLPSELPPASLSQLSQYLRKSYGKSFMIDAKLNPGLIAGCALVWNGVIKDYSLRQRIQDNQQAILASFKRSLG